MKDLRERVRGVREVVKLYNWFIDLTTVTQSTGTRIRKKEDMRRENISSTKQKQDVQTGFPRYLRSIMFQSTIIQTMGNI